MVTIKTVQKSNVLSAQQERVWERKKQKENLYSALKSPQMYA